MHMKEPKTHDLPQFRSFVNTIKLILAHQIEISVVDHTHLLFYKRFDAVSCCTIDLQLMY